MFAVAGYKRGDLFSKRARALPPSLHITETGLRLHVKHESLLRVNLLWKLKLRVLPCVLARE